MLALASCTSDEPSVPGNGAMSDSKYLAVSLASNSANSRAAGDQVEGPDGNSIYEVGQESENYVKNVRFFFFDEEGNAIQVKADSEKNWIDVLPTTAADGEDMPNIEKALDAMIILEKGDQEPASIMAIINHPFDGDQGYVNKSDLITLHDDYSTTDGFLMSNSVYKTPEGKVAIEVPVTGHLYSTPTAAKNNPITIYLERVLAKVRVNMAPELTKGVKLADAIYRPGMADGQSGQFNGKDLCVKILGWNVTNTTNESYLVKNIDPAWSNDLFGASEPWNFPAFFRSFWAVNPTLTAIDSYTYGDFTTDATDKKLGDYTYMQENAADKGSWNGRSTARPTQVILAAQLGNYENGKFEPVTVAEWAFNRFTIADLKTAMLAVTNRYYKKVTNADNSVSFKEISQEDLTFKTAMTVDKNLDWSGKGRYYVYCQLTDEAAAADWYKSNTAGNTDKVSAASINKSLKDIGHAKIWENGYTYYYFDIRHIGTGLTEAGKDNGGYYGVVRNHLYDARIKSLVGLGTPVYDPTEVIYPEKPVDDDTYIAADIKILSWRLVKQDIDLEW